MFLRTVLLIASGTLLTFHCSTKSGGSSDATSITPGATSITVKVSGAKINGLIALSVINEATRLYVSGYNFDFTPGGDKADAAGNYSKTVTGLTSANTYTLIIRSDMNGDMVQDTNDVGQTLTGISPGATANFTALQVLSTLSVVATTDSTLANKVAGCFVGVQNYQLSDLSVASSIGYAGLVAVSYSATGAATPNPGYFPPGTYANILCAVDMNGNNVMNTGDKYQFISGPITLPAGVDTTTFTLGAWITY